MMKVKIRFLIIFAAILMAAIAGGWGFTDYLIRSATGDVHKDAKDANFVISSAISHELATIQGAVKAMSGSPFMAKALTRRSRPDMEGANGALDRYNNAIGSSVAYLMDGNGKTIASSNRDSRESFVGQSYGFRPYFRAAMGGNVAYYFAVGATTGRRAFFAGAPVKTANGQIIGVAAMKLDLDDMEVRLGQYQNWFLLSPDGIIFLSSKADARLKSLWPLDHDTLSRIKLSMQFGARTFAPLLPEKFTDGSVITLAGNPYLTNKKDIGYGGWSIVVMAPTSRIQAYRSFGVLLSIFVGILFLGSHTGLYLFRQSAERIRKSEALYRILAEKSFAGVYVVQAGVFRFINSKAASYAGYNDAELIGKSAGTLVFEEDRETQGRRAKEMLSGLRAEPYQFRIVTKDGGIHWIMETVTHIDYEGKPAILGNSMDITDLKKTETKLREKEELYRLLTEKSFAGIYVAQEGVLKYLNSNAVGYTGYTHEEIVGKRSDVIVHPEDIKKQAQDARDMIKGLRTTPYEFRIITKQGQIRWIMETIAPFIYENHPAVLANCMDITTQKRAEEALRKAYNDLANLQATLIQQQKMASIGQLSAGISHEINNPIGFIKGNLEVLKTYMKHLETIINTQEDIILRHSDAPQLIEAMKAERKRLKIDYIHRDTSILIDESLTGAERISSIVRSLKAFSMVEDAEFRDADINESLSRIIDIMRNELPQGVELITSLEALPITRCNIGQLSQAFMAILKNATQAINGKGEIRIATRQASNLIVISFSDTGVGIPDDLKDRIFEPFFTTREVGQGMGLGLSTAYDIIKKHSGEISLETEVGKGSTFTIRIPVAKQ